MTMNERLVALAQASEEVLQRIDAVLEGCTESGPSVQEVNNRLLTVTEACRYLNMGYPKFYRVMQDGLVDVVDATGRRLVREQSLVEFAQGRRHPSQEVLERRKVRNAKRREEYAKAHALSGGNGTV